jgi:hypothetical protein
MVCYGYDTFVVPPCHSASIPQSANNVHVLWCSLDNTARLFDRSSGEMLMEYTGHKSSQYKVLVTTFIID